MARQKDMNRNIALVVLFALVVIVGMNTNWFGLSTTGEDTASSVTGGTEVLGVACPDDLDTSQVITVHNDLNESGDETFTVQAVYYTIDANGKEQFFLNDAANGGTETLACGQKYVVKLIATDGASGDGSYIVRAQGRGDTRVENGNLLFTAEGGTHNIEVWANQLATIEMRARDNINDGLMFDSVDASATDYETTGVVWMSTTGNTTKYTETDGIDTEYQIRAIQSDTNGNDRAMKVLLELPTNVWNTPTVVFNGQALPDMKGNLNADESKAWSSYEYVYIIPGGAQNKVLDTTPQSLRVSTSLLSGVTSASADPEVDIGVSGYYLSSDGVTVKEGGVKDDSAQTVVRTLFHSSIDVT